MQEYLDAARQLPHKWAMAALERNRAVGTIGRGDATHDDGAARVPADGRDPMPMRTASDPAVAVAPDEGVHDAHGPAVLGGPVENTLAGFAQQLLARLVSG